MLFVKTVTCLFFFQCNMFCAELANKDKDSKLYTCSSAGKSVNSSNEMQMNGSPNQPICWYVTAGAVQRYLQMSTNPAPPHHRWQQCSVSHCGISVSVLGCTDVVVIVRGQTRAQPPSQAHDFLWRAYALILKPQVTPDLFPFLHWGPYLKHSRSHTFRQRQWYADTDSALSRFLSWSSLWQVKPPAGH